MWIKICGTTNLEDALLAADAGADALGFIFAPSQRQVTAAQVAAITPHLPPELEKVGVFTDPDHAFITRTVDEAGLTAVQLHMPLDPTLLGALHEQFAGRVHLIQVVTFDTEAHRDPGTHASFTQALTAAFIQPELFAVLLDAAQGSHTGGLGTPFSWQVAAPLITTAQLAAAQLGMQTFTDEQMAPRPKLLLAGGLRPENVAEAISILHPWGVDVVSGVERKRGRKDPALVKWFITQARLRNTPVPRT